MIELLNNKFAKNNQKVFKVTINPSDSIKIQI